jgi:hypothetical protein
MSSRDTPKEAAGPQPQGDQKRPRVVGRIASYLARPFLSDTHRRLGELWESVYNLQIELNRDIDRALTMIRHAYEEEPANRRRLYELRRSEEYKLAFTEDEPLVSFLVPTYTRYSTLGEVSLPSILDQTYSNIEVIVVGDCAPAETERVISQLGDPRVRYYNRTVRGPYPEDETRWYVVGTPPYNEALSQVRGRWIAALGDDDAVRPDHTEKLVRAAQENRWEHCYGRQLVQFSEGQKLEIGEFPPRSGQWGLQAAIYHAGLRFMELELTDALYHEPNDWSLCRRMLRAGVSFGMIDDLVVDKHEARSAEEWAASRVPEIE